MDAEGNQYKQSGFSQIKTLHKAFLFNNTLILRRNVPADPHARISCQSGVNFCLPAATQKKTVPPPGGTVLDIFLVQLYKKVCQSQPPTDFLFAPEIIFGAFFKTGSSFCRIKKKARKFSTNQRAFFGRSSGI